MPLGSGAHWRRDRFYVFLFTLRLPRAIMSAWRRICMALQRPIIMIENNLETEVQKVLPCHLVLYGWARSSTFAHLPPSFLCHKLCPVQMNRHERDVCSLSWHTRVVGLRSIYLNREVRRSGKKCLFGMAMTMFFGSPRAYKIFRNLEFKFLDFIMHLQNDGEK